MSPTGHSEADRQALRLAMRLSLLIGSLMLFIKVGAYLLTGSAAILSDASESVVHIAAVTFAAYSLRLSHRPADDSHLYGHAKISFFSAGFEGAMIILAALFIIYQSIAEWVTGLHLENLGWGTLLTLGAGLLNGGLGYYLLRTGRQRKSLILIANGKHVLTDCWTSLGVLVGLALTWSTGWLPFDPLCGIAMALNILVSGIGLVRSAFAGLMDAADPAAQKQLIEILQRETRRHGIAYHEVRHRNVGDAHWVELHLLFPPDTLLVEAHRTATLIEHEIERSFEPRAHVITHLESTADHRELHPTEPQD